MPDLVAHLASASLASLPLRDRRSFRVLFLAGVLLPDVSTRAFYILLESVSSRAYLVTLPLHTPLGYAVLCLLLSQLFRARRTAFVALLAGGGLHFAFDLLQAHVGAGYFWAFPFSWQSFELGWFGTEASTGWLPITASVVLAVEIGCALRGRRGRVRVG